MTCADLPFTTAYHHDLGDMISPGQPALVTGYAGGGKRKHGGYPQWFDKVPKKMSRKQYLKNLEKKRKLREKKTMKRSMKRSRKSMKRSRKSMKRSRKSMKRSRKSMKRSRKS